MKIYLFFLNLCIVYAFMLAKMWFSSQNFDFRFRDNRTFAFPVYFRVDVRQFSTIDGALTIKKKIISGGFFFFFFSGAREPARKKNREPGYWISRNSQPYILVLSLCKSSCTDFTEQLWCFTNNSSHTTSPTEQSNCTATPPHVNCSGILGNKSHGHVSHFTSSWNQQYAIYSQW